MTHLPYNATTQPVLLTRAARRFQAALLALEHSSIVNFDHMKPFHRRPSNTACAEDSFVDWQVANVSLRVVSLKATFPPSWKNCFPIYQKCGRRKTATTVKLIASPCSRPTSTSINSSSSAKCSFQRELFRPGETNVKYRYSNFIGEVWADDNGYTAHFLANDDAISFQTMFFIVVSHVLSELRKQLLHASGVLVNDQVWLFSGKSGSGKTTIATELRGIGDTFSVDKVVLFVNDKGRLCAYPTPFSDIDDVSCCTKPAPVAGIVFIEQAKKTTVTKLSTVVAMVNVLKNTSVLPNISAEKRQSILDFTTHIISAVDCYKMEFSRDAEFWKHLEAM